MQKGRNVTVGVKIVAVKDEILMGLLKERKALFVKEGNAQ